VIARRNKIQNNTIMKFGVGRISRIFSWTVVLHDDLGHVFIAHHFCSLAIRIVFCIVSWRNRSETMRRVGNVGAPWSGWYGESY
jgi:hypothetical protein